MGRVKHGLALAGQSWQILRSNRSLLGFPLLGAALSVVIVGPPALAGVLIALGAILFAAGVLLSTALQQVFAVVLYRYTTSGQALGGFAAEDLERSVRTRPAVARA
jgi:hypothetical protein